jgi:TonB family protein
MKLALHRVLFVTVASTLLASVGHAQDVEVTDEQITPAEKLQVWDDVVNKMRSGVEELKSAPDAQMKDSRGRTLAQDAGEYVFSPKALENLARLREEAQAKIDDAAAFDEVMDRSGASLMNEVAQLGALGSYWRSYQSVIHHGQLLEPWISGASEADRETLLLHLRLTEKRLIALYEEQRSGPLPTEGSDRILQLRSEAIAFYNERRSTLARQQSGKEGAPPLLSRKRETPCAEAARVEGDREKAAFAPGNEAPEEVYPAISKSEDVEGVVIVRVELSEKGCMQSGEVTTSSGVAELDDAALLWAERAQFLPVVKAGKGEPSQFSFRVNFELK